MFFILSKILYAIVAPASLITLCFLFYFFLKKKYLLYSGVGLFLFFTNPFIGLNFFKMWEIDATEVGSEEHYDGLIILGGFVSTIAVNNQNQRTVYADGNDRLIQAISLYKKGVSDKIIYTAGTDSIFNLHTAEALLAKEFMLQIGIPDSAIITESRSINTYENALFTKQILESRDKAWHQKRYLLVTSAFHMRRSMACFKKQGFNVIPYSTNFRALIENYTVFNTIIPSYGALQNWTYLIKEWIGMLVYKAKGYI